VAEAGSSHFDLIDPARVEEHVKALVERLTDSSGDRSTVTM
jgi:hypothetical protein